MYCQKCGAQNTDDATFCYACGALLHSSSPQGSRSSASPPISSSGGQPPSYDVSKIDRKNPIITALLNFFLFGLGYLYLGYRRVFGVPTIVFVLIVLVLYIIIGVFTLGLGEFIIGIFMAYDGYVKADGGRGLLATEPEYIYGKQPSP
jgi:uncharacterized membrane protein YvbJ